MVNCLPGDEAEGLVPWPAGDAGISANQFMNYHMKIFRSSCGCRIAQACAALLLATAVQPETRAGSIFNMGNDAIQGITGPGANQLTTPYATLDFLENTSTGTLTFTLS